MCIKKYFGKSILNEVFSKYFQQLKKVFEILKYKILDGEYFKYQILNTKSISNTYFKYKYFKYCPALDIVHCAMKGSGIVERKGI